MKILIYSIEITSTAEKVWQSLWDLENYKQWTAPFCKGSYYKTEGFVEGQKIHLLTPKGDGMYSILDKIIPYRYLVFRHIGTLKDFEEQPIDNEVAQWTDALETYSLESTSLGVMLIVSVDTFEAYEAHMNQMFPKALVVLKELCEQKFCEID